MTIESNFVWLKRLWKGTPLKALEPIQPLVLPGYKNDLDELQAYLESNDASVERLARMAELFQKPSAKLEHPAVDRARFISPWT